MAEQRKKYRLFLSAAEHSADAHCAKLITSLKQTGYNIEFIGVGGEKMAAAGCQILETTAGKAAMIYNAFAHIARFYKLIKRIETYLKLNKVDLVILCDSPAFNFHVAKAAKKYRAKTLFYVAPQLWAWGDWRLEKLKSRCDKLCCILPFEQKWFGEKGLDAAFVGNPLLDDIGGDLSANKKEYLDFDPQNAKIALLPGSRPAEIAALWRPMQQIAVRLKRKYRRISFTAVAVDEETKQKLRASQILNFKCTYVVGQVAKITRESDFAIVASGSTTLEVAAAGCPMVIMYQSSRLLWHLIGRWLLKTEYLSLVNILAQKELVPEFMPYFTSIDPIEREIARLLDDTDSLIQTSASLTTLTEPLCSETSENVAKIATSLLD